MPKTYLITGSAGFIGYHVAKKLLEQGVEVIGIDNFNYYYDPALKEERNRQLGQFQQYKLYRGNLADLDFVKKIFAENKIDKICNLAAQAGVRYSLQNPYAYIESNIVGFTNLINEAKNAGVKDFIYASSSSLYGLNKKVPYSVADTVDSPISLYAATKRANELIAHSYHHLYGMNCTGLRFFTVYGPYGRPDMAYFLFAEAMRKGEAIKVFNYGKLKRDFTYIDDIVDGVLSALGKAYPFQIFNLGNNQPVELEVFISTLEKAFGLKAKKEYLPMQPGDVLETMADITKSQEMLGFQPKVGIEEGLGRFVEWYRGYYSI